jgi:serine/threonine protein kinase
MTVEVGTEIEGARLTRELERGGMATVYLAEDLASGETVVVKVLKPELARHEQLRRRFVREARYAESLDHPHIVGVRAAGQQDGAHYIVMQYVQGTDLRSQLAREGPLPPADAVGLLSQVADALDTAHASGLLHRDVKPGNVLIASGEGRDPRGYCYLTDFGLSKDPVRDSGALTVRGEFVGSVLYAAPEQILAVELDARADIYSLGCVLYESLVGTPPFPGELAAAVMQAHLENPPPKPSKRRSGLPSRIDAVIARALAKEPGERYGTCRELIEAAARALGVPVGGAPAESVSVHLTLDFDAPEAALAFGKRSDVVRIAPEEGRWRILRG